MRLNKHRKSYSWEEKIYKDIILLILPEIQICPISHLDFCFSCAQGSDCVQHEMHGDAG